MAKKRSKEERVEDLQENLLLLRKVWPTGTSSTWLIGIDPGRTQPGVANWNYLTDSSSSLDTHLHLTSCKITSNLVGFTKSIEVEHWIRQFIMRFQPTMCILEDYSYESPYGREAMAETQALIMRHFWYAAIPIIKVAPVQLKSFIGCKKKEEILKEVYKKWGIDANNSDESDAVVLAKIGRAIRTVLDMDFSDTNMRQFEAKPHQFCEGLSEKEARIAVNLIITRGAEAYNFARGKELLGTKPKGKK